MSVALLIHEGALVELGASIGAGTRVGAFAQILSGACIGRDCDIGEQAFVENDVTIGDRVTITRGVHLWSGVRLDDDVFVGPGVTFTNDLFPRSKANPPHLVETRVQRSASLGANSTILGGLTIGQHAMVGAGAVVTKSVPPYAIVVGNPAWLSGYVTDSRVQHPEVPPPSPSQAATIGVPGAQLIELPLVRDLRGDLSFAEVGKHLPFEPKRVFWVFNVPSRMIRGEHAHRKLHQLLLCIAGSVSVMLDDGKVRDTVVLDRPNRALHVPPMVWASQYQYSPDAVLIVLASDVYNADDYIREYEQFLREK